MLNGTFPRFFSQFREGALIHAQWSFLLGSTLWSRVSTLTIAGSPIDTPDLSHNEILVLHGGTGIIDVTLPKGRVSALLDAFIEPLGDASANQFHVHRRAIVRTSQTVDTCRMLVTTGATVVTQAVDGAQLHVSYWVGR